MSKHTVQRYMTVNPIVISSLRTLSEAHQTMREHGVRHLPVVDAGKLVGVVSQRDLYLLETLRGVDATSETVDEAMTPEPYAVPPDASIEEVAREMAQHKYGSAVVVDRGAVVGIFTSVDGLRALSSVLRRGQPVTPRSAHGRPT
ncbi:MAG TPA: CBS domain-containing protein [Anaeromyxobacteraceae bacterium]